MSEAQKVSFIIGGVQKGGTTALFRYLEDIPSLAMSTVKETHFFDDEQNVDWNDPDYDRYHAMFPPPDGRPRGEATPIYIYWPGSLERIARYNPDIKLIFLFRDPVQRAWSQWKMEYARDWETLPFAQAIRQGRSRVDNPRKPGFHRVFSYVERGFYAEQLKRVYALFPKEQVLLIRSEDLDARPNETLARICAFVGAAPPAPVEPRRELVAKDIAYPSKLTNADIAYLRDLYADDLAAFGALSGLDVKGLGQGDPTDKRAKVLDGLRLDGLGLEVGAGYGPLTAGWPGLNCRSLDHLDQAGLQAKFAATDNDMALVPPVDYVWSGERYRDLVGETRFDWIVASHVIEHVPDMIGFINECAEILAEGGVLSLVVPDKRRTFDLYRPPTGLGGLIDAHLQKRRTSSPGLAAEFAMNLAKLDGRDIWTDRERGTPQFEHDAWRCGTIMEEAASGAYVDIHAWVFTPSSFRLLIEDLNALGLIALREARIEAGGDHEFFIQLSRHGQGPDVGRETLSKRALLEQPEAVTAEVPADPALTAHNAALQRALDEIRGSTVWKLAAPLRWLGRARSQSQKVPMNREASNRIRFLIEDVLPPFVRDSRLFGMAAAAVLGDYIWRAAEFRKRAPFLTEAEYETLYRDTPWVHDATDNSQACLDQIVGDVVGASVCDVGCGTGYLLEHLRAKLPGGTSLTGCDFIAPKKDRPGITFVESKIETLPFPDGAFDTVVCTHVLEHILDLSKALSELRRIARRRLIIVVPREREGRYTFNPHFHFFPYAESFLRALVHVPERHRCRLIGRDIYYVEERDPPSDQSR